MNNQILEFIKLLLEKEPPSKDRTEILKFYTLPRNTDIRPVIELPDEEALKDLGPIKRMNKHDIERRDNPKMAEEEDAVKETLKGVVDGKK